MLMNLDFTIVVKQKHDILEVHKHVVSFIVNFCHSSQSKYSLDEKLCRKKGEMGGYFWNVFSYRMSQHKICIRDVNFCFQVYNKYY